MDRGSIMAHFAKIENGKVTNVVVVDDNHEANGEDYLNSIGFEGTWIQTSFNSRIRGKFAGIGDVYNAELDRFEPIQPYPSWTLDEESYSYIAPTERPPRGKQIWNEETLTWKEEVLAIEEDPAP
jgi:hypothetical protein